MLLCSFLPLAKKMKICYIFFTGINSRLLFNSVFNIFSTLSTLCFPLIVPKCSQIILLSSRLIPECFILFLKVFFCSKMYFFRRKSGFFILKSSFIVLFWCFFIPLCSFFINKTPILRRLPTSKYIITQIPNCLNYKK